MVKTDITKGSITRSLIKYFLPIWAGTFFQFFYNTVDAIIVGNFLGKDALAAVGGPAAIVVNLFTGFFVGVGMGASVLVSQFYGARDAKNTSQSVHSAMALGVIFGAILSLVGIFLAPLILQITETPSELTQITLDYLNVYFGGVIFTVIYNLSSSILRAIGDSRRPLVFLVIASIVNIVLDIVFILIIPMGVAGAALATVISQAFSAVLVIIVLCKSNDVYKLYISKIRPHAKIIKNILKIGIPAGLQISVFTISGVIIQAFINSFGTNTIAAWSAYSKIDGFMWMTLSAVGTTITTFSGQNFGAKNITRVKKGIKVCSVLSGLMCIVLGGGMLLFADNLFAVFVQDEHVVAIGVSMMLCMIPFYLLWVPIEVLGGTLRGAGDTLIPTLIQAFGVCGFRILWMFVVLPFNHTVEMLCLGYPASWAITSLALIIYYYKGNWVSNGFKRLENI